MFTNEKLNRRSCLKGISLGVGGMFFAPLLQKVAAAADGNVTPPKRFIFFLFDNGFQESAAIPMYGPPPFFSWGDLKRHGAGRGSGD